MSKLSQIKDALVTEIQKIAGIGATGTKLSAWYEEHDLPAAFVGFASETKEPGPTRSKEGVAEFFVHTIVEGDDSLQLFMNLYEQIEKEIEDDPSLGGLALDVNVGSNAIALVTSETIAQGKHVADVLVTVKYRHDRGAP